MMWPKTTIPSFTFGSMILPTWLFFCCIERVKFHFWFSHVNTQELTVLIGSLFKEKRAGGGREWGAGVSRCELLDPCVGAKAVQSCLTLCDPTDCSPPGSSVHELVQVRMLQWVAVPSSRGSSPSRDQTCISYISCIGRQVLYHLGSPSY